jgi:AraC family transcriptional regulator
MPSKLLRSIPDEWGPKFEACSGAVTRTLTGPNSIKFNAPSHMALVMLTPQPGREVSLNSDRRSQFLAPQGNYQGCRGIGCEVDTPDDDSSSDDDDSG